MLGVVRPRRPWHAPDMAISDWELWACAQAVLKQHGARAADHAAERIAALETAGDEAGVRTWRGIATRIEQLSDFGAARSDSRQ
jgi:hypothetical protein